jgi:alpha-L-fucosidase
MNGAWGFNITDKRYKSTKDLVRYLVRAAGSNANFLLNVGPMANGKIQPEFVTRLAEVGKWIEKNGESIYGTRGGPISPRPWGVTTKKGDKVYVHVFDTPDASILLPPLPGRVRAAALLNGGRAVTFKSDDFGTVLTLPRDAMDPTDTIVVLDLEPKRLAD